MNPGQVSDGGFRYVPDLPVAAPLLSWRGCSCWAAGTSLQFARRDGGWSALARRATLYLTVSLTFAPGTLGEALQAGPSTSPHCVQRVRTSLLGQYNPVPVVWSTGVVITYYTAESYGTGCSN